MNEPRVLLGYVVRAHGIKGALRVRPASGLAAETARSLAHVPQVFLDDEPIALTRVRPERDELLIELAGLSDRTAAEALRGRSLFVPRSALPPPDEDELYLADLVGCSVYDQQARLLGVVTGTYDSGAQDVLILDASGKELLLPFVEPMLVDVDLAARRISYDPPPGMVDDADAG